MVIATTDTSHARTGKLVLAEFDYSLQPCETFPGIDQREESKAMYQLKKNVMPPMYWHGLIKGQWKGPGHHAATRLLQRISKQQFPGEQAH
jgi:hypothetical protein